MDCVSIMGSCVGSYERLFEIRKDLLLNNFEISAHAYLRMHERRITAMDILCLIKAGLRDFYWSKENGTWNFTGYGFDERMFTIACAYDDANTLIVTIFWN